MFGTEQKPSFQRGRVTLDTVREKVGSSVSGLRFIEFLESLDPTRYAIFHEKETHSGGGRQGYRVVHFNNQVEEKWHDIWGQTWYGLGAWML